MIDFCIEKIPKIRRIKDEKASKYKFLFASIKLNSALMVSALISSKKCVLGNKLPKCIKKFGRSSIGKATPDRTDVSVR